MLARGQQGSKPFDNLSAFRPCIFMNTLSILMGISELSMRVASIILFLIRPPFSLFSKRPGRLKGRIRYYLGIDDMAYICSSDPDLEILLVPQFPKI